MVFKRKELRRRRRVFGPWKGELTPPMVFPPYRGGGV
jgi:hypothetical protein